VRRFFVTEFVAAIPRHGAKTGAGNTLPATLLTQGESDSGEKGDDTSKKAGAVARSGSTTIQAQNYTHCTLTIS
jgi:hypothetical protein